MVRMERERRNASRNEEDETRQGRRWTLPTWEFPDVVHESSGETPEHRHDHQGRGEEDSASTAGQGIAWNRRPHRTEENQVRRRARHAARRLRQWSAERSLTCDEGGRYANRVGSQPS